MLLLEARDTVKVEVIEEGCTPSYVGQPDFVQLATIAIIVGSTIVIILIAVLFTRKR